MSEPDKPLKFTDLAKVFPVAENRPKPIQMVVSTGDKPRLLLADDDPVFTLTLFHSLAQKGYEIIVAENGIDAIAELRKADHPPVAILDWKMPGMDGVQICERMRDADKIVYLIMVSADPSPDDIVAGLEMGADLFLPKSVAPALLLAYVKVGMRIVARQKAAMLKADGQTGGR